MESKALLLTKEIKELQQIAAQSQDAPIKERRTQRTSTCSLMVRAAVTKCH